MATYRLIGDHGSPAGEYDADDDSAAEQLGRELSQQVATSHFTGFRVERLADTWVTVAAWMPTRVHDRPNGAPEVVPPATPRRTPPDWVRPPR